jgi:hypothetical protein
MNINIKAKILLSAFLVFVTFPFVTNADIDNPEVKANMIVTAIVPTKACGQYSSVVSNVAEILSDASQKATITVKVFDCANLAISGSEVTITSNRGSIDKINQVDSDGDIIVSGDGQGLSALTDINGFLFYQVYSSVAGESTYTARVDSQLDIGQVKITYLPLPFPKNISVVVEVPKIIAPSGEITIFKPKNYDIDREKLVNLTMELTIPVWVFYLVTFISISNVLMFLTIMLLVFRIRKMQKVELADLKLDTELLQKEETEIEKIAEDKG